MGESGREEAMETIERERQGDEGRVEGDRVVRERGRIYIYRENKLKRGKYHKLSKIERQYKEIYNRSNNHEYK